MDHRPYLVPARCVICTGKRTLTLLFHQIRHEIALKTTSMNVTLVLLLLIGSFVILHAFPVLRRGLFAGMAMPNYATGYAHN